MTKEEVKEKVKADIEQYHQTHFWECYPAGTVQPWVYDAVIHGIIKSLTPELLKEMQEAV